MTIIDLQKAREERSPHLSGKVRCLNCKYEWVGVAPIGTVWVECPECGSRKACFYYDVGPNAKQYVFECNCGCDLLRLVSESGEPDFFKSSELLCANCGVSHRF